MQHVPPGDLCGFAGIATLMPLLGLRRTPATRTRLQKFSSEFPTGVPPTLGA